MPEERRKAILVTIPPGPPGSAHARLDAALLQALHAEGDAALSRNALKAAFRDGGVLLDGRPAKPAHPLPPGEHRIEILDWEPKPADVLIPAKLDARVSVAFEDDRVLVLNKPAGMPTLPRSSSEPDTAVNAALALAPSIREVGRGGLEPGLLHRLDSGTSGLVAFAKTKAAFEALSEAWREERVTKIYRAVVTPRGRPNWEPPLPSTGEIDVPLAHSSKSSKKMVAMPAGGRPKPHRGAPLKAITRVLSVTPLPKTAWDLEIEIVTGVMHQIRAHVADSGWPVVGDDLYGGSPSIRLWLHAWKLELPFPDGSRLKIEAPLPEGWPLP